MGYFPRLDNTLQIIWDLIIYYFIRINNFKSYNKFIENITYLYFVKKWIFGIILTSNEYKKYPDKQFKKYILYLKLQEWDDIKFSGLYFKDFEFHYINTTKKLRWFLWFLNSMCTPKVVIFTTNNFLWVWEVIFLIFDENFKWF